MEFRNFTFKDYEAVIELWTCAGIQICRSDSIEGLKKIVEREPDLFFVAEENHKIIGAVMGTYDGRRGWVNHLAVHPEYQGKQLGTQIMKELEKRFKQIGCEKINLLIEMDNTKVQKFYEQLGFNQDELVFMEKWIDKK
ncbi:GNAT family acetyltransferase [Bacillus sp. 03113]|uniref:GNAT family acetyltransferase n=1 Tax=Bacillus sp. 03113 TaxID=2578211 RepID=UPI0011429587|nr:GNAT family acetyltransferase [Bacillus sp. 03113]